MIRRKIEAWTDAKMIGALIQADDGSIEQIDDSLREALGIEIGDVPSGGPNLAPDLITRLHDSGFPNVALDFPWEEDSEEEAT